MLKWIFLEILFAIILFAVTGVHLFPPVQAAQVCLGAASVEPTDDFKDQVFKLERDKRQVNNNNWNFGNGNDNGKHS